MNCLRCRNLMYRVKNIDGTARATCTRCGQFVDCARCSNPACSDAKCLGCYNKTVSEQGRPKVIHEAPIIQDEPEIA